MDFAPMVRIKCWANPGSYGFAKSMRTRWRNRFMQYKPSNALKKTLFVMSMVSAILTASSGLGLAGDTVEVKLMNKGADRYMVFEPEIVRIKLGDSVKFVAADKGHNAVSIRGVIPEGAQPFAGKINEEFVVTPAVPGVYGFRCDPHFTLGMVGIIVVGEPTNLETAKAVKLPGKAGDVMTRLLGSL